MSDTARAKILDRGACLHPGPRENWPCAICIQERITAYAAEQTAGLRAKRDAFFAKWSHKMPQAMYVEMIDLLADPEGQP